MLEVFKNTLPTKLHWTFFPIEDLRQAVEMAKGILTKEELDKQLTGQTSTSPFLNIRGGTERKVSFNTRDELGDKIDKLTVVMNRLAAKDSHGKRPFRPQVCKNRGQNRSYNQGGYQNRSSRSDRVSMETAGLDKTIGTTIFEGVQEDMEEKIIEEIIETIGAMNIIEAGMGQEKEHPHGVMVTIEIEVPVTVDQGQGLKLVLTEIG